MAIDKILGEIAQIETIIEKWKTAPVSNIERELVLEKLRKVYDKVIFIDDESIDTPEADELEDLMQEHEQALSFESTEQDQEQVESEDESRELQHEIYGLDESEEDQHESLTFTVPSLEDQEEDQEEIVYFDDEDAQFDEEEDDEVENLARIKNTELDEEIKNIFGDSEIDKNAISSLYGQDSQELDSAEAAEQEDALEVANQTSEQTQDEPEEDAQAAEIQEISAAAEHAVVKPAKTLRSGIGMNDKYIMTRNMFNSDSRLFEQTINHLDEMTDINEALLYINDNFSWNPDDDSVKLLVSLLEDKLM